MNIDLTPATSGDSSDTTETTNTEASSPEVKPTKGKKGPKKVSETELRLVFAAMKKALKANGLALQVDEKSRCTVVHASEDVAEVICGPMPGSKFLAYCKGAEVLVPFAR